MEEFDEVEDDSAGYDDSLDYAILTTLMRIYDVVAADLTLKNPEVAKAILKVHAEGGIFNPLPVYSGRHIFNEKNDEADAEGQGEANNSE